MQHVMIVQLEDERDCAGVFRRGRLEESERRRIRIASGIERELEVISGIIRGWIDGEAAGRAMLKTLVNREDDELSRAAQPPRHQQTRQVGEYARAFARIVTENFLYPLRHHHELP